MNKLIPPNVTPGDWEVTGVTRIVVFGSDYASIGLVCNPRPDSETTEPHGHIMEPADFANPRFLEACANARLMSKAKKLGEALERLWSCFEVDRKPEEFWIEFGEARKLALTTLLAAGWTEEE